MSDTALRLATLSRHISDRQNEIIVSRKSRWLLYNEIDKKDIGDMTPDEFSDWEDCKFSLTASHNRNLVYDEIKTWITWVESEIEEEPTKFGKHIDWKDNELSYKSVASEAVKVTNETLNRIITQLSKRMPRWLKIWGVIVILLWVLGVNFDSITFSGFVYKTPPNEVTNEIKTED